MDSQEEATSVKDAFFSMMFRQGKAAPTASTLIWSVEAITETANSGFEWGIGSEMIPLKLSRLFVMF